MKTSHPCRWIWNVARLAAFTPLCSQAALIFSGTPNLAIPDNNSVGIAQTVTVTTAISSITSVKVSLEIAGGFNGDYFAYLSHGSTLAVLLNRPGRTENEDLGYHDSGLAVTFSSVDGAPDIHTYRDVVNPGGGPLTGLWGADARNIDPLLALDTTPRTAGLDSFSLLDPNGDWTLFVADRNSGGIGVLKSWEIVINGTPPPPTGVPDRCATLWLLGLSVAGMVGLKRRVNRWRLAS